MILLLFCLVPLSNFAAADPVAYACSGGNYTAKSAFQSNLNLLLASLSSPSSNATFRTDAKGSAPDRAYGLVLCRGDVGPTDCITCLESAARDVLSVCPRGAPLSKQATVWYNDCELRYADVSFFSVVYEPDAKMLYNGYNATDIDSFVDLETKLLDEVMFTAAHNSTLMFATGVGIGASRTTIYALAQCTRDLSNNDCGRCLREIRRQFHGSEMQVGGRVFGQSCRFWYETAPFFHGEPTISLDLSVPPPSTPPSAAPREDNGTGSGRETGRILLIVIPVAVGVASLLIFGICLWRRSAKNIPAALEDISRSEWPFFNLTMLKVATDNFSDSKKIGQGGFGSVYRGTLANGEDIAVKRLSASSRQGIQELKNELVLVAKLQHKNLVRLRGVCLEEDEKLLVYEYVPNGSLDNYLFDSVKCKQLNWEIRFKIITGVAQGLLYLHEESPQKVIHRDLKASNVLLNSDMSPKISDFGLARLFAEDETHHITRRVVGTFGYMAPEYARRGHFSMKLDIYSFGILVLEVVTGKRSNGFSYNSETSQDILSYTWKHWRERTALEIVDPSMNKIVSSDEVLRCIQIALLCTQEVPAERPPMSSVYLMLRGPPTSLQEPLQPRFVGGSSTGNLTGSSGQTGLSSSQEFAGPLKRDHEDRPLIKQNTWESKQATRSFAFGRQTT